MAGVCSTKTPLSRAPARYSATWRSAPGGAFGSVECASRKPVWVPVSASGARGRYPNSATARDSRSRASYSPTFAPEWTPFLCLAFCLASSFMSATHPSFWIAASTSGTCLSKTPSTLGSASRSAVSRPETKSRSSIVTSYTCAARAPRGSVATTRLFPPAPRSPSRSGARVATAKTRRTRRVTRCMDPSARIQAANAPGLTAPSASASGSSAIICHALRAKTFSRLSAKAPRPPGPSTRGRVARPAPGVAPDARASASASSARLRLRFCFNTSHFAFWNASHEP